MLYKVKSRLKYNGEVYEKGDKIRVEKEDPLFGSDILEEVEALKVKVEPMIEQNKKAPKRSERKK